MKLILLFYPLSNGINNCILATKIKNQIGQIRHFSVTIDFRMSDTLFTNLFLSSAMLINLNISIYFIIYLTYVHYTFNIY